MKLNSTPFLFCFILIALNMSCSGKLETEKSPVDKSYFDFSEPGIQQGGVKMVEIQTPKGTFKVWTKRIGNNPTCKLLLVNGGPGLTHDYFECFENFMPKEGIEIIYYDQLSCGNSDNPKDTSLYDLDRYVEEVEQLRKALALDSSNFFLLGHSWGGILGMQYALKYQHKMKGLIIAHMMASCPAYGQYANDVLAKQMDPKVLDTIRRIEKNKDYQNPKYMGLLMPHFYKKHILRMEEWPEPLNRSFAKINAQLYETMQGPSEFGISGKLTNWDVSSRLKELKLPTLVIGAKYDSMDPKYMEWMSQQIHGASFLLCAGSHMSLYDDQQTYFKGLTEFLKSH
jgi:proline iminopeptidase